MCNFFAKIVLFIRFDYMKVFFLRIFIKNSEKVLVFREKVVPLHPQFSKSAEANYKFGVWCNGNTADSGPAFPGSSPGTPTKREMFARASLFLCFNPYGKDIKTKGGCREATAFNVYSLFSASIALIFSLTNCMSSLSF